MTSITGINELKEVARSPKNGIIAKNSVYNVDLWRELTRRWLVAGVFFVIILAVLTPGIGASGGIIHTEYSSYLLLSYIYYLSGRQTTLPIKLPTTLIVITCAHTHIVIPCIHVVIVSAIRDLTDIGIVKGALYSSVGAPTMWLSMTLSDSDTAATVVAFNYIASLVAIPLSMYILCGHPSKPGLHILTTVVSALLPYVIGLYHTKRHGTVIRNVIETRAYTLILLYVECCSFFDNAGGVMNVVDLFAIILLVFTCLLTSTTACWAYARCGLIDDVHSRTIALCSMSKSIEFVSWRAQCAISGASLLLAALPARAIILAAISDGEIPEWTV